MAYGNSSDSDNNPSYASYTINCQKNAHKDHVWHDRRC